MVRRRVVACRSTTLHLLDLVLKHKAILLAMSGFTTFPTSIVIDLFLAFSLGILWFLPLVSTSLLVK